MTNKDDFYKLIIKNLTSGSAEDEDSGLQIEDSQNSFSEEENIIVKEFWENYYHKPIKHTIKERTEQKLEFSRRLNSNERIKKLLRIASIILLIFSLSYSFYHIIKPKQQITLNEYSCGPGEKKEVTLSDGTHVWINSSSFIIASEPFVGETREVKLFGEAYFEVAHNPDKPFIVKTPFLQTKVLGTKFNVTALSPTTRQEIELYEGKVQLISEKCDGEPILLIPGEKAYFTPETGKLKVIATDLGKPAQWRNGILRFYNEDLFSISKKLERKFRTRIFITDSLVGKLKYSAEFDIESLTQILDLLQKAQNFKYEKTENGIIIQSNN